MLSKYLDATVRPKKLPNILSLVLYHGAKKYPYEKDIFSCFTDKELAAKDLTAPMLLIDIAHTPEDTLLHQTTPDALLKLLLKYSREKDLIRRIQTLMRSHPAMFVSLSLNQARFVFEYVLAVGRGNPKNATIMKAAMHQVYGEAQGEKIFSLLDYFREEARQKAKREGKEEERNAWRQKVKDAQKRGLSDHQVIDMLLKNT